MLFFNLIPYLVLYSPLVVFIFLLYQKKISKKPSHWRFPPRDRVLQFTFSYTNIIWIIPLYFILGGYLTLSTKYLYDFEITNSFIVSILLFSIASIYHPKFVWGIFLSYLMLPVAMHLSKIDSERPNYSAVNDMCNSLRISPICKESANDFDCKEKGVINKELCRNKMENKLEYDIQINLDSPHTGKTYEINSHLLYIRNLPRKFCEKWTCGYVHETKIEELVNRCLKCEMPVTTKLRATVLPKGSKIKVIGSFRLSKKNLKEAQYPDEYLILKDEKGVESEMNLVTFDSHFKLGRTQQEIQMENNLDLGMKTLEDKGFFSIEECKPQGLNSFISNFDLYKEIRFKSNNTNCVSIDFLTKEAFSTYRYFY